MEARPTAIVIGSCNIVSLSLTEEFLTKNCNVVVITNDVLVWQKRTQAFIQNTNFKIQTAEEALPKESSYAFLVAGVEELGKFDEEQVTKFLHYFNKQSAKTAVVLPYLINEKNREEAGVVVSGLNKIHNPSLKVFYLGEVFGPKLKETDGYVNSALFAAATKTRLHIPEYDFEVFPVFIVDAVKAIVKGVFSYSLPKQSVVAQRMTVSQFLAIIEKAKPSLVFIKDKSIAKPKEVKVNSGNFLKVASVNKEKIKTTLDWITGFGGIKVSLGRPIDIKKINLSRKPRSGDKSFTKYLIISLFIFIWILLLPFFALFISGISLKRAYSDLSNGQVKSAQKFLSVSDTASFVAKVGFDTFAKVPLMGNSFRFFLDTARFLTEGTQIGKESLKISNYGKEILTGIFGNGDYNLTDLSEKTYLELGELYQDMSLFQTEIDSFPSSIVRLVPQSLDIKSSRKLVESARDLSKRLPTLMGMEKPQTYLILFQNNMELRPTGGFIGSFGLVTMDRGKLTDSSIFDVYAADGQLKGHVEPPSAIKTYLGEANWFLRDSNWDPDFPTSANKAEWFLGKELDRPVDGVVGVDLEVAKSFLKVLGPVKLTDFNAIIDYKNMYDKIEYEVQSNFFPGSQKKASILTSLSKEIIDELMSAKPDSYVALGKAVFENLSQKHIEIFFHDRASQEALSKANWDGAVSAPVCRGNCVNVWLGMVDANVGVNKANYFIKRSANLIINIMPERISNQLEINYTNNAPTSSGLSGNYKNYLRVLTPIDAVFTSGVFETTEIAGHKEVGVLVEVSPGTSKKVVLTWETLVKADFRRQGSLIFNWRKQAGTGDDPVSIRFVTNVPSLTRARLFGYNTTLTADFNKEFDW